MSDKILEKLAKHYTKSAEKLYMDNGNKFFEDAKYHDAIAQYNIAIKLNPTNPFAYYTKAISLIKIGKNNDATQSLDHVMRINPNYFAELNAKA